jgi:hypothetical protein
MAAVARTTSPMLDDLMMTSFKGADLELFWFKGELETLTVDKIFHFD